MTNEEYYDQHIAPKLTEIGHECEKLGMSFLAVCEYKTGEEYATTKTIQAGSSLAIRLADGALQSEGNIDALILGIMKSARKHGHSSLVLKQLGVNEVPQP